MSARAAKRRKVDSPDRPALAQEARDSSLHRDGAAPSTTVFNGSLADHEQGRHPNEQTIISLDEPERPQQAQEPSTGAVTESIGPQSASEPASSDVVSLAPVVTEAQSAATVTASAPPQDGLPAMETSNAALASGNSTDQAAASYADALRSQLAQAGITAEQLAASYTPDAASLTAKQLRLPESIEQLMAIGDKLAQAEANEISLIFRLPDLSQLTRARASASPGLQDAAVIAGKQHALDGKSQVLEHFVLEDEGAPAGPDEETAARDGPNFGSGRIIRYAPNGDRLWVCENKECSKVFARLYNLRSHERSHQDEKPYQCPVCPVAFARNHDLKRHVKIHVSSKSYLCRGCDKNFSRMDALKRHKVNPKSSEECRNSAIEPDKDIEQRGKAETEQLLIQSEIKSSAAAGRPMGIVRLPRNSDSPKARPSPGPITLPATNSAATVARPGLPPTPAGTARPTNASAARPAYRPPAEAVITPADNATAATVVQRLQTLIAQHHEKRAKERTERAARGEPPDQPGDQTPEKIISETLADAKLTSGQAAALLRLLTQVAQASGQSVAGSRANPASRPVAQATIKPGQARPAPALVTQTPGPSSRPVGTAIAVSAPSRVIAAPARSGQAGTSATQAPVQTMPAQRTVSSPIVTRPMTPVLAVPVPDTSMPKPKPAAAAIPPQPR